MLLGSVSDDPLVFLRDAVLFVRVKIPPAVLNPSVDSGLTFFKALRCQQHRLSRLPVSMWIEIDPISRRLELIRGHTEANHLPGIFAHASGRMADMCRENEMGDSRFRDPFHPRRFLDTELGLLPINRRPLH